MSIWLIMVILLAHYLADFVLQPREIAINKHKGGHELFVHCAIYTFVMFLVSPLWGLLQGILHYAIDVASSRISHYYWEETNDRGFWLTIGADQMLHAFCLFGFWGI